MGETSSFLLVFSQYLMFFDIIITSKSKLYLTYF